MSAELEDPPVAFNGQAVKPPPVTLRNLAMRLTPNPALTVDGTLQIILDGIEKIDDEALARALAQANARQAGLDAPPITDEDWRGGDIHSKLQLLQAAKALKQALRQMGENP
jgi:hypothetical protein